LVTFRNLASALFSVSLLRFHPVSGTIQIAALLFLRAAIAWAVMAAGKSSARTPWTVRGGVCSQRWLVIVFFTHKCRDDLSAAEAAGRPVRLAAFLRRQSRQQLVRNI
jgi:hypothetical protein